MPVLPIYVKDPQAVLDYILDWSLWLQAGEAVTSSNWTVPVGLTKESQSFTSTTAKVWLSDGTAGVDYTVTCQVTTNQGRTDHRSILLRCRER